VGDDVVQLLRDVQPFFGDRPPRFVLPLALLQQRLPSRACSRTSRRLRTGRAEKYAAA